MLLTLEANVSKHGGLMRMLNIEWKCKNKKFGIKKKFEKVTYMHHGIRK